MRAWRERRLVATCRSASGIPLIIIHYNFYAVTVKSVAYTLDFLDSAVCGEYACDVTRVLLARLGVKDGNIDFLLDSCNGFC